MNKDDYTNKLCDFKDSLNEIDIKDIMITKSVKKLSDYDHESREKFNYFLGTPGHVKAALSYNDFLNQTKNKSARRISNGMKIKFAYLRKNPYNLESIAMMGFEDPPDVIKFINDYIDRDKIFDSILANKLQSFYDALGWGAVIVNRVVGTFFNF
jgi:hypothetical protein